MKADRIEFACECGQRLAAPAAAAGGAVRCPRCGLVLRPPAAEATEIERTELQATEVEPREPVAASQASTAIGRAPSAARRETPFPEIPGFDIEAELGRGGMGVVYRARDVDLDRVVALKVLPAGLLASREAVERFQREARAAAGLDHPKIVKTYSVGEHAGAWYIVQEFVEGTSLDRWLKARERPPAPREAAEILLPIVKAVEHAHSRGVVHRDIKPANVLVGSDGRAKLADFGLARREGEERISRTGDVMGTPAYMAPEQAEGNPGMVGPRTDVYALGTVLYEMLAGKPPFAARSLPALYKKILFDDPPPPSAVNPKVGREIEAIALKCLDKLPARRYQSATALAKDLAAFLTGEPVSARPPGFATRIAKKARRNKVAIALVSLALLVLAAAGWFAAGPASLRVKAEPPDADIWVDGERAGTGEVALSLWPPGRHRIEARRAGCTSETWDLDASAGGTYEKTLTLIARAGTIRISTNPAGAEIWLDGRRTERKTPAEIAGVLEGTHVLVLRLAGHQEAAIEGVEVKEGDTLDVSRDLLATTASLVVDYQPAGARVELVGPDGVRATGKSPARFDALAPGHYDVRISAGSPYLDATLAEDLAAGVVGTRTGALVVAEGNLEIHVDPAGSKGVLVREKNEGNVFEKNPEFSAPFTGKLPIGRYDLRLTGPGDESEEHWSAKTDWFDISAETPEVRHYRLLEKWRVLWTYETGGAVYSSPTLADLDGDGVPDAVVGSDDRKLHAVSGRTGVRLWAYETGGAVRSSPALADLDGDGVPDAVVGSNDRKLHAVSGRTGTLLWAYKAGGEIRSSPAIADLDGDGVPDAVVGSHDKKLHIVSGRTGTNLWAYETGGALASSPALADLDGDGVLDAVVGSIDARLHAVSGRTGARLWAYETGGEVLSSPALADLDGDGVPDAIVGSHDKNLHVVSGKTGRAISVIDVGAEIPGKPVLGDLDGDGRPEVVVAAGSTLYAVVLRKRTSAVWNPGLGIDGTAAQALLAELDRDPLALEVADWFLPRFPDHEAAGRAYLARARGRRAAGDLAGARADLEAARTKGLRSVELYREILAVAPEWELPKDDTRLAIAAGMQGVALDLPEWDPDSAPLDADVLGAAAFQAYRAGRFGHAVPFLERYFRAIHREPEGEPWLARARLLAELGAHLSAEDLARLVTSAAEALRGMDAADRARVDAALAAWKAKHPGEGAPVLPW